MPFIQIKTNQKILPDKQETIKKELGEKISLLGKSESWLMIELEQQCCMYFKGKSDKPMAMVEVTIYGKASSEQYEKLTQAITKLLQTELEISPEKIYISYTETQNFAWNGSNF